jgi:hypothetical protein
MKSEKNQGKEKHERKIREHMRKLVLDLCVNGELNERIKCMDKALEWNNDELMSYIYKSLPKSERQIYLKDTEYFNSLFRIMLSIFRIIMTLLTISQ